MKLRKVQKPDPDLLQTNKAILDPDDDPEAAEPTRDSTANQFGSFGQFGTNFEIDEEDEDLGGFGAGDFQSNFADDFDGDDAEDVKLLEDLEDKQLLARIKDLEGENSRLTEKVWKLEHGRTWVENRLTALEGEVSTLKGTPLNVIPEPE